VPDGATYFIDSPVFDLSGDTERRMLRGVSYLKGLENHAVVDVVVVKNASGAALGGNSSRVTGGGSARRIDFIADRTGVNGIRARYRIRNGAAGEVGAKVRLLGSFLTLNVERAEALLGNAPDMPSAVYVPQVTALADTFAVIGAANVHYTFSGRRVFIDNDVPITTNGSAAGAVRVSLPAAPAVIGKLTGREVALTGNDLQGELRPSSNVIEITRYDNAYPGSNGARLVLSGSYEWA
jgi:hypothetical protein